MCQGTLLRLHGFSLKTSCPVGHLHIGIFLPCGCESLELFLFLVFFFSHFCMISRANRAFELGIFMEFLALPDN